MSKSKLSTVFILFAIIPPSVAWNGFVLTRLWQWLIVPSFELRPISIMQAIVAAFFVRYLISERTIADSKDKTDAERIAESVAIGFFYPLFALGMGYILSFFV